MKKFLLVLMIGIVLALDIYGVVANLMNNEEEVNHIEETTTIVYVE